MATIGISGYSVLVDDEDLERINERHWYLNKSQLRTCGRYYFYNDRTINGEKHTITLHRFIMQRDKGDGKSIDHIDGNTLNCQKNNLRVCLNKENVRNSRKKENLSGYKGVQYHSASKKWQVRIMYETKGYFLGLYTDPLAAAKIYDMASMYYFGEYANTNFPKENYIGVDLKKEIAVLLPKFTSKYTGVYLQKSGKWGAQISYKKQQYYLGSYNTEEEAAQARAKKEKELTGEAS